uniref:Uncharacterized protein n=1 Tax=Arundo donax TaxID=35708 RepID=A0A0A9APB5_ARUDO
MQVGSAKVLTDLPSHVHLTHRCQTYSL